jgi:hypothetical protein
MNPVPINHLAVLACGVASMVLGSLWYGPVFGKAWIALSGFTPEKLAEAKKKSMAASYGLMFVGALLMAYVLAHSLVFGNAYLKTSGPMSGAMGAFWNWLGFIAPVTLGKVLWDGKPWKLWMLDSGYYLVLLVVMGIILTGWK